MLSFIKYFSAGRDYLLHLGEKSESLARLSPILCCRERGVGACGILSFHRADRADATLTYYLPDGGTATPDTPALCCVAKHLYDFAHVNRTELCLSYEGGSRRMALETYGGVARCVRVGLGYPVLDGASIPCRYPRLTRGRPVILGGGVYSLTCLSVGSPFACLSGEAPPPREALDALLPDFPEGVTVLYVLEVGQTIRGEVLLSRPTDASLEGAACALAVANAIEGKSPFEAPLLVQLGNAHFSVTLSTRLFMSLSHSVREVCRCQIDAEELCLP